MDSIRMSIAQQIGELFISSTEMSEALRRKDAEIARLRKELETKSNATPGYEGGDQEGQA